MITNFEQKQWNFVSEMNASRLELARVKTEAESAIQYALLQQNSRLVNAEATATNAVLRAQTLESEIRSVKSEAEQILANRLQHGLEVDMNMEALRGEKHDAGVRFTRRTEALTAELDKERSSRLSAAGDDSTQSATVLHALLQEAQEEWSKAAASLRTTAAHNEQIRAELSSSVGLSVFKLSF